MWCREQSLRVTRSQNFTATSCLNLHFGTAKLCSATTQSGVDVCVCECVCVCGGGSDRAARPECEMAAGGGGGGGQGRKSLIDKATGGVRGRVHVFPVCP